MASSVIFVSAHFPPSPAFVPTFISSLLILSLLLPFQKASPTYVTVMSVPAKLVAVPCTGVPGAPFPADKALEKLVKTNEWEILVGLLGIVSSLGLK